MSDAEREHWDHRYATEGARTSEPASFLVEVADRLPAAASILDVGGGSGRNAIWLAQQGHRVTVVDISAAGLGLATDAAEEAGVAITTVLGDLDAAPLPSGPWDVVVDFHFIKRHLFPQFMDVLRPGGLLVFCRATVKNLERNDRPPQPYLLEQGEGWELLAGFELLIAREGWSAEGRHEFEALGRRPPNGAASSLRP